MAKKIIILEQSRQGDARSYQYVLWATVPATLQSYYADNAFVSAYDDASVQETADLRSGAIVEKVGTEQIPLLGKPVTSLSADEAIDLIKGPLMAHFDEFQNYINTFDPNDNYGDYWDGSAWVEV